MFVFYLLIQKCDKSSRETGIRISQATSCLKIFSDENVVLQKGGSKTIEAVRGTQKENPG